MSEQSGRSAAAPLLGILVGLVVLVLGTSGCSGGADSSAGQRGGSGDARSPTAQPGTADPTPASPTPAPPPPPPPPVVGPGPCPYLEESYVEQTVGQRMARVETITVEGQPIPDCIFYRPDDTAAVRIDLTAYPDAIAAQNAALAAVTPAATPITDLGDYGGVLVSPGQTVLAVSTGALLLVVTTNQETSLQARDLATTVLAALPPP